MLNKKVLRKEVLAKRDLLSWEQVEVYSKRIAERLFSLPEYQNAQTIMYFLNFGKEVATIQMVQESINHGKRVVVPKTQHEQRGMILSVLYDLEADLAPGVWGIPEPKPEALRPIDPGEIGFVVVPGVAFTTDGDRLGYGGGYYDRFFPQLNSSVPLVALTFEAQLVPSLPTDPWDRKVDIIITPDRAIYCRDIG